MFSLGDWIRRLLDIGIHVICKGPSRGGSRISESVCVGGGGGGVTVNY